VSINEKKPPKTGITWKGFVPDTDPSYTGGWNYLIGKNLNPHSGKASKKEQAKPEQEAAAGAPGREKGFSPVRVGRGPPRKHGFCGSQF